METEEITIRVDPETARVYKTSSENIQQKLNALFSIYVKTFPKRNKEEAYDNLVQIMNRTAAEAEANGMTPEILADVLGVPVESIQ